MYLPLMLDMAGQPVVCVGAGPVAAGKLRPFVAAGGAAVVIAPEVSPAMTALMEAAEELSGTLHLVRRSFLPADLDRSPRMVIAATARPDVDDAVSAAADRRGVWCLRVDGGEQGSSVALPAMVQDDGVTVALTTGVPALSRRLRMELQAEVAQRWGPVASVLAALRRDPVVTRHLDDLPADVRRERWRAAVDAAMAVSDLPESAPPAGLDELARTALLD
ncbi:precorrin-2 dehydrogenase/sirohydrochlorin ferrochelatase family protein [Euzebya tangerina]|uniref:precorrin-2 dehydrogenase/sirohydrochlorin ferrochelatase family protein n=1 Tax=Euzebya tangerina TaxID=591198 RepID=UPI000E3126B0|nr:NAD(P)-dependent oxidoreductase [Euzebya tangerina]